VKETKEMNLEDVGNVVYYFTICLVVFGVYLTYAKSCSFRRARVVAACDCARCRKKRNFCG